MQPCELSCLLLRSPVAMRSADYSAGIGLRRRPTARPFITRSTGADPRRWSSFTDGRCDETSWDAQVPVFEKSYRVITLDLPGHGQSGAPTTGSLTMELFAKAIEAVRVEVEGG